MQVQSLLSGNGRISEYVAFKPTPAQPEMTYASNLVADGTLPEPSWCVAQQSLGNACSTGGRFEGSVAA